MRAVAGGDDKRSLLIVYIGQPISTSKGSAVSAEALSGRAFVDIRRIRIICGEGVEDIRFDGHPSAQIGLQSQGYDQPFTTVCGSTADIHSFFVVRLRPDQGCRNYIESGGFTVNGGRECGAAIIVGIALFTGSYA